MKSYIFTEKYLNEFYAFKKYYEAICNNGYLAIFIKQCDHMKEPCELFKDVNKDFYKTLLNYQETPRKTESKDILYASDNVSIKISVDNKRSLLATRDIVAGDVLIHEHATILQMNPTCACSGDSKSSLYRCFNCALAVDRFYVCDTCDVCIYCSPECKIEAYTYHKFECYGFQRHFWSMKDTDYSYIAMRMMMYGITKLFVTDEAEGEGCYGNKDNNFPAIYKMETHFQDLTTYEVDEILYNVTRNIVYLIHKTNFFNQFKDTFNMNLYDAYMYVGGLMTRLYCQAQINAILLKFPNYAAGMAIDVISNTGKAICPTISLLNHSCCPNATLVLFNRNIVVRALKPIQAGKEITICYSEMNPFMEFPERYMIMKEIFHFTCQCDLCVYQSEVLKTPFKCIICKTGRSASVVCQDKKEYMYCFKCKSLFSNIFLKKIQVLKESYEKTSDMGYLLKISFLLEKFQNVDSVERVFFKTLFSYLYSSDPIKSVKYGIIMLKAVVERVPNVFSPVLITKFILYSIILNMNMKEEKLKLSKEDIEYMQYIQQDILNMKHEFLFYLPNWRMTFYGDLVNKLEIFKKKFLNFP